MSARVHLNSVTEKLTQSFKGSLVESHNSSSIGEGKVQDAEWFASLHLFPAAAAAKSLQSCPMVASQSYDSEGSQNIEICMQS